MKLSSKSKNAKHKVLLFGPPKGGKTQLAGNCAAEFNLLWIDLENGYTTLQKLPEDWQERIELISLPDTRGNPIGIETVLHIVKGGRVSICEEHGKVNCAICKRDNKPSVEVCLNELPENWIVVFDSLTQLTNSAIAHITKGKPDDYKMEFDDWGNLGKLLDTVLSYIQQGDYHCICISHETEVKMEDGKNKLVPTAGTTNFSRNTARYFGEVFYTEVKNGKHRVGSSTAYGTNILTGSRTGAMLDKDDNASLIPIFKNEVKLHNPVTANSPANKAADALAAIRAKNAGNK